jgi:hypothetical protein
VERTQHKMSIIQGLEKFSDISSQKSMVFSSLIHEYGAFLVVRLMMIRETSSDPTRTLSSLSESSKKAGESDVALWSVTEIVEKFPYILNWLGSAVRLPTESVWIPHHPSRGMAGLLVMDVVQLLRSVRDGVTVLLGLSSTFEH